MKKKDLYRDGYLNQVYKKNETYVRKSKKTFSFWENEKLIYQKLNIPVWTDQEGGLKRPWIKGQVIKKWNPQNLKALFIAIEKFHQLDPIHISVHNWFHYQKYASQIDQQDWKHFCFLVKKHENDQLVVSHNDINRDNVLYDNHQIHLIDFEWANLNSPYFDYVSFYLAEGIRLNPNLDEKIFQEYIFLTLIYFLLWSNEAPQGDFINQVIKRTKKQLLIWKKQFANNN